MQVKSVPLYGYLFIYFCRCQKRSYCTVMMMRSTGVNVEQNITLTFNL